MHIDFQARPLVLALSGEFDLATAGVLSSTLGWLLEAHGGPVVVDVSGVAFIDVTGAAPLLAARGAVEVRGDSPAWSRLLAALDRARCAPAVGALRAAGREERRWEP